METNIKRWQDKNGEQETRPIEHEAHKQGKYVGLFQLHLFLVGFLPMENTCEAELNQCKRQYTRSHCYCLVPLGKPELPKDKRQDPGLYE